MEKKNVGYYSNPLEDSIIKMEKREKIETLALSRLTSKEKEVLELRYGLTGDVHTVKETAEILGVVYETIRITERRALQKLRTIILAMNQYEIVDSKIGMSEVDLYKIARNTARHIMIQYGLVDRDEYRGLLTQHIKDMILWRLSSEERKVLLFYSGKYSLFPKTDRAKLSLSFAKIQDKLEGLVLGDALVCKKAKINVKV